MIPFLSFDYQDKLYRTELIAAMTKVLDSKWYILGKELEAFEQEYAALHEVKHAIGVANGLDALIIALKVLGIKEGDEVIVPSNTYIATWLAVSQLGAIPVPVEPNMQTYNIDPDLIESHITAKTKAILPVHLYGQPCDMIRIMEISNKHGLYVVEDNAQAHLAKWNGKLTGTVGNINATCFYPGKNLGAIGDGGGLTTQDDALAIEAKVFRNYGSEKKYYNKIKGLNSRLDELQAAILRIKLPHLDSLTESRKAIAQRYAELLSDCTAIILPFVNPKADHVYHLYVIQCERRDKLQQYLSANGVGTMIHYPVPPHLQEAYQSLGYQQGDFPLAEQLAKTCLSLPLFPGMTDEQIVFVVNRIKQFFQI